MLRHPKALSRGVLIASEPDDISRIVAGTMAMDGPQAASEVMAAMLKEMSENGVIICMSILYGMTKADFYQGGRWTGYLSVVHYLDCERN